ncbi:E3 ubiquitin-protein ligase/Putative upstream regulatory element binding protein [Ceraceosorus bombacis]|uniref:E3 ubiquitin-protein ligase/Putative upstream regulatory element binding protein n=1 Tax=Ceraceosorus bombacis TaxID=401625 RepID=A0A0P1BF59_9BASI|nr:E3 ubiquitin-protein ligase/Putative upstream regulatory element binding protein [Ceraceosorus bombacis]
MVICRRSPQRTDLVALVQEFLPVPTSQRWSEAARLVYTSVSESAERLVAHIVNVLQLRYRKSQQELQRKKETQRQLESKLSEFRREKARLAAELEEAKADEAAARTAAGQTSHSVTESGAESEAPAGSSSNRDSTEDDDEQARMAQAIALSQTGQTGGEDVEMEATSAATEAQPPQRSGQSTPSADSRQADMELESLQRSLGELERRDGAEQPGGTASARTNATPQTTSAASGSEQPAQPRLTTTIRGRTVDITDSGIDPTFLEALPDDMREEVVNQHFRERRAGASMPALTDSSIAPEFLEALPPEIRAEVMRAEAAEAQRTAQAERSEASTRNEASASRPTREAARSDEVDPSSFIATLDPGLRDAALAQRDNTVFDRLPAGVAAELDHLRRVRQNQTADGQTVSNTIVQRREVPASTVAGQHQSSSRDAIQVLDKSGVATLVRLLFFPQMSSRSTVLHKVLANVQENARTREELLNLLLMILADGITDTHAVDKSYASMSARAVRTSQLSTGTPARPPPKRHHTAPGGHPTTPSQPTPAASQPLSAPISRTGEEAPFLIASRSIDTLLHLTHSSEQTAWYFLREDVRGPKKIAKGKEKADLSQTAKEPRAPINILLGLLNKQAILGNPQLVDSLVALLSSVTKPLTNLPQAEAKETTKKDDGSAEDATASGVPTEALSTGSAQAQSAPTRIETSSANLGTPAQTSSQPSGDSPPVTVIPVIPAERIAVVVKPLGTAISSRGFQHTLSIASNLTAVPGGRDVIIGSLRQEAEAAGKAMVKDLDELLSSLPVLPKSSDDDDQVDSEQARVQSPVLSGLADGANSQAVLLRSLRAIEWLTHHEATASA